MRFLKKITAITLVVAMMMSLMSIGVFAEAPEVALTLAPDTTEVKAGAEVTVTLNAKAVAETNIAAAGCVITYNSNMFEVDTADLGVFDPYLSEVNQGEGRILLNTFIAFNLTTEDKALATFTFKVIGSEGVAEFNVVEYEDCWADKEWSIADVNVGGAKVEIVENKILLNLAPNVPEVKNGGRVTVALEAEADEYVTIGIAGCTIVYDTTKFSIVDTSDYGAFNGGLSAIDYDAGVIYLTSMNLGKSLTDAATTLAEFEFIALDDIGSAVFKIIDYDDCWADVSYKILNIDTKEAWVDVIEGWVASNAHAAEIEPFEYGTDKDTVIEALPTEATIVNANGTKTAIADVTDWTCDNYDGRTAGDYKFTGKIAAGDYGAATVEEDLTVSVNVIVNKIPLTADMIENSLVGTIEQSDSPVSGAEIVATLPSKAIVDDAEFDIVWNAPDATDISVVGAEISVTGTVVGTGNYEGTVTVTGIVKVEKSSFKCIFVDEDGTVLKEDDLKIGDVITPPADPTKEADAQYTYTFAGWDGYTEGMTIESDMTFTAKFDSTVNTYTVTWLNYDGSVLETDTNVPYGEVPLYKGEIPEKNDGTNVCYAFTGWDKEVVSVSGDVIYTAEFEVVDMALKLVPDSYDIKKGRKINIKLNAEAAESLTVGMAGVVITYDTTKFKAVDTSDYGAFNVSISAIDHVNGRIALNSMSLGKTLTDAATTLAEFEFIALENIGSAEFKLVEYEDCWGDTSWDTLNVGAVGTQVEVLESWIAVDANVDEVEPVEYGTDKAAAIKSLPAKATLVNADGTKSTKAAVVDWTCDNYDGRTAGDYKFTGKIAAGDYGAATVEEDITVTVKLTVNKITLTADMIGNELTGRIKQRADFATGDEIVATLPSKAKVNDVEFDILWETPADADISVIGTEISVTGTVVGTGNYEGKITVTGVVTVEKPSYMCIFLDDDGTVLKEEELDFGAVIVPPSDPSKAMTTQNIYTFSGWEGYTEGMVIEDDVTFTAKYDVTPYVLGDINNDGRYNAADSLLVIRMGLPSSMPNYYNSSIVEKAAADVNGDGRYNAADALLIIRRGLPAVMPNAINKFPIEG